MIRRRIASIVLALVVGCDTTANDAADGGAADGPAGVTHGDGSADDGSGPGEAGPEASSGDATLPDAAIVADAGDAGDAGDARVNDAGADARDTGTIVDGSGFFDASGDDAGTCNTIANPAPQVAQVDVATARPAATGGNIIDGTYYKSQDVNYTGAGGSAGLTGYVVRETLLVTNAATGTALLTSVFADNNGTTTERLTMSPTTGGGATILTFVCPAFGPSPTSYNVRVGAAGQVQLDIYISTDRIETFTRQ